MKPNYLIRGPRLGKNLWRTSDFHLKLVCLHSIAQVHQVIAVALTEGDNLFGWLTALNHLDDGEFGTVEASILSSVAAILNP